MLVVSTLPLKGSPVEPEDNQFQELIRRVRARDEDAATQLMRRYESAIRRVVRIHLRDPRLRRVLDSMDICQSVLATFFARAALGQYDLETPEQLLNLLASITRNKLTNQAKRLLAQKRDLRRDAQQSDPFDRTVDRASDPGEQASAKEILEKIRSHLDVEERYLADQRALGCAWKELADELGGTDVALRKKLTRALDRVMGELGLDNQADE
jgi:RNA polymerase sigma factor (sigma-70 family)